MSEGNSKQRIIIIAAITAGLLLLVNVFLLLNKTKQEKQIQNLEQQADEAEQLKTKLEKEYYQALSELEEMKGSNEELNALIEEQQMQLEAQKDQIDGYLADNRRLGQARSEINKLKAQAQEYIAQIQQLQDENADLKETTAFLASRTDSLSTSLQEKAEEASRLSTAKAALTSENEALNAEKSKLKGKVDIASVIQVKNVNVQGFKTRKNGKPTEKKQAKNIEYLKICFDATANKVTNAGYEAFNIRIVNPLGETLAEDNLGSGVINNKETGESIRFTKIADAEYDQSEKSLCTNWNPDVGFVKGKYEVEVYNKGYLAGMGSFELK